MDDENNLANKVENAAKSIVKSKLKQAGRKILMKILFPWGIIIILVIFILLITLGAVQGFMSANIINDRMSDAENTELQKYLQDTTNSANGTMKDFYGTDKKLALKPGYIEGYLKFKEMEEGKDIDDIGNSKKNQNALEKSKLSILKYSLFLKPLFQYDDNRTVTTIRKYKVMEHYFSVSNGIETDSHTHFLKNKPNNFSVQPYSVGDEIYIYSEDKTYKIESTQTKDFTSYRGRPTELNNVYIYYNKPRPFYAEDYSLGEKIYIKSLDKTYIVNYDSDIDYYYFTCKKGKPSELINSKIKIVYRYLGSVDDYNVGDVIYAAYNDKTYTVVTKTDYDMSSYSGKPNCLKDYTFYADQPLNFDATKISLNSKIYIINENKTYLVSQHEVEKTETKTKKVSILTNAKTIFGTFKITYEDKQIHYNKSDGQYTETRPVIKDRIQTDKPYEPLKELIKLEYPNEEDINMAISFIINSGSSYENKSENGSWINADPDNLQLVIDNIFNESPETMSLTGPVPQFFQDDTRWASYPYAGGTIRSSGCGVTCLAMCVTGLEGTLGENDSNGDGILDPQEAAAYSTSQGCGIAGEGTSWSLFEKAASTFGLKSIQYDVSQYNSVLQELQNGHPVIASMSPNGHFTNCGHFIVLTGITADGKITINDPISKTRSEQTWDYNEVIVPEAVQFFALSNPNIQSVQFLATAYDLSYESCQKNPGDIGYGITTSGYSLVGKDIKDRKIAVDTSIIPLNKKVFISFPTNKRYVTLKDGTKFDMNGYYTSVDTGGAIKSHHIDIYMGEDLNGDSFYNSLCMQFGSVDINISIKK